MKKSLLSAALALSLLTPACLGPDNLYGGIKNWNAEVSDQDWLNEVIFVGFWIIPVYPFALLGDVVIFNTIEYWTGDNPIKEPGEFPGFSRKSAE
jgi:hypothetical protein